MLKTSHKKNIEIGANKVQRKNFCHHLLHCPCQAGNIQDTHASGMRIKRIVKYIYLISSKTPRAPMTITIIRLPSNPIQTAAIDENIDPKVPPNAAAPLIPSFNV